jgi:hypothetical protein
MVGQQWPETFHMGGRGARGVMNRGATLWALMTLFWGLVTIAGIAGVLLEVEGRGWALICWVVGVILTAVSARLWHLKRV